MLGLLPLEAAEMDWICCAQCQGSSMTEQELSWSMDGEHELLAGGTSALQLLPFAVYNQKKRA